MKPPTDDVEVVLRPLLRLVGPKRAELVRAAVSEGIDAVAPLLALWAEETYAAEGRAALAAAEARSEEQLAQLVDDSFARLFAREEERWTAILRAAQGDGLDEPDADTLVAAFGLGGPVSSAAGFDAMMRDPTGALTLGPGTQTADEHPVRDLDRVARRAERPPDAAVAEAFSRQVGNGAAELSNLPACGVCVRTPAEDAVLLGDGTWITVRAGRFVLEPASTSSGGRELSVFRLASGRPPVLVPSARAALASCLVKRDAVDRPALAHFALKILLGADVQGDSTPTNVAAHVARLLHNVADAASPDAIAAPLLEIASLVFRVHVRLGKPPIVGAGTLSGQPIQVGRVRWCGMSDSPRFWIPVGEDDPDVVGGPDRPWTREIPSAGALWQTTPSSIRLDPDWYARIVVIPGDSQLWCVDPEGVWWSLDSDFDAVVRRRREHLAPWLVAIENFEAVMPANIDMARRQAAKR